MAVPGPYLNDAMAGLLTYRSSLRAAFPKAKIASSGVMARCSWSTVAGTAPEFDRVPFSLTSLREPSAAGVRKCAANCQLNLTRARKFMQTGAQGCAYAFSSRFVGKG